MGFELPEEDTPQAPNNKGLKIGRVGLIVGSTSGAEMINLVAVKDQKTPGKIDVEVRTVLALPDIKRALKEVEKILIAAGEKAEEISTSSAAE